MALFSWTPSRRKRSSRSRSGVTPSTISPSVVNDRAMIDRYRSSVRSRKPSSAWRSPALSVRSAAARSSSNTSNSVAACVVA